MPVTVWTLAVSWAFERGREEGKKTHGGRAFRALPVLALSFEYGRVSDRYAETSGMMRPPGPR